uniref:tRNA (adenine(22)-N(1))-methyltransferase n=1 Tax=Coprococcus sp. TaxID=2049024 RepID=UPI0040297B88
MIELSKRMQSVADMIQPCDAVGDIGCDHAFVSIYLVEQRRAKRVIASDVRRGPIAIAKRNIEAMNLSDQIEIRMGDGLDTIVPGEVNAVVLAGMGGMLMIDILERGEEVVTRCDQLVLQPQSDIEKVRRYLAAKGYHLADEQMLIDAGKYYNLLDVRVHEMVQKDEYDCSKLADDWCYMYGGSLLRKKDPVLRSWLVKRRDTTAGLINSLSGKNTENAAKRLKTVKAEQKTICAVLKQVYGIDG